MTLDLTKKYKHTNPYNTNWHYLQNMTSLQVKAINRMNWIKSYREIHTGLGYVPKIWIDKEYTKNSVELFIITLNIKIMGL